MSGQKINDHGFWAGKGSDATVLPTGMKTKNMPQCEGAGEVMDYPDTAEAIYKRQESAVKKLKNSSLPSGTK